MRGNCERELAQAIRDVLKCPGLPDCPLPPVVRIGDFFVFEKSDGTIQFCNAYYRIYTVEELRRMLDPNSLESLEQIRFWKDAGTGKLCKQFIIVQCVFYNLGDSPSKLSKLSKDELRDKLRDPIMSGQLVGPEQSQFEKNMRSTLDKEMTKHRKRKRSWERKAARKRKELAKNEKIARYADAVTSDAQASILPEFFIRDHFLSDGQPDPDKTPDPVTMTNFTGDALELVKEVQKVPGLWCARQGKDPKWVFCIGWNKDTVDATAVRVDTDIKSAFWAEEWARTMAENGYDKIKALPLASFPSRRTLENCLGHFAVVIPPIRDLYREFNILSWDASHRVGDVVVVKFDMGFWVGTLLIAASTDALDQYCQRLTDPALAPRSPSRSPNKKKRKIKEEPNADPILYPNAAGQFKLFFRFRGVERSVDSDMNIIRWKPLEGNITFKDRSFRKFHGRIDFAGAKGLGQAKFLGIRLAWEARERAPGWNDFSWATAQQDGGNREVIMVDDA